jgi:hypothetical protein
LPVRPRVGNGTIKHEVRSEPCACVRVGQATPAVNGHRRITEDHMRLLEWLDAHPKGSLAAAAQALELAITEVEVLCADLVDAGMIEGARMQ